MGQDVSMEIASTPTKCFADGTITITLKGNDAGKLSQIIYTVKNTTTQDPPNISPNPFFENLSKGSYSVTMDAYFQNVIPVQRIGNTTVGGNYTAPTAFKVGNAGLIGTRKTLNCRNTGCVSIEITGGIFPYYIDSYLNSSIFRRDTFHTYQNSGTDVNLPNYKNYYNIENLPAGSFTFKIKDGCNYGLQDITETISHVYSDFLCNNIAITSTDNISHSNNANIDFGENFDNNDDLYKYYYDHRYRNIPWWEYTFSFDGGTEKDWKNIPTTWYKTDTVASASKYCDIWNKNYQIKIRVKGCTGNACNTTKKIQYHGYLDVNSQNIFDANTGCVVEDKIKVYLHFHSDSPNAFCTAPVKYKITDVQSGQVLAEQSANARFWYFETVMDRTKVGEKLLVTVNDKNDCLLLNENYTIQSPPDFNWQSTSYNRICNSASDFDQISWSWNECINTNYKPPDNSKIELIESPNSNYYHFVATFNRNLDKWNISQDNNSGFTVSNFESCFITLQGKDLLSGTYKWHITDCCGRDDIIQSYYEFYNYVFDEPFSFDVQVTCDGKIYYPKVKMALVSKGDGHKIPATVLFDVSGVAGGYFPATGVCNTSYVTLTRPGEYQMYFNYYGTNISCLIPEQPMYYAYDNLSLKNVYGYACNDGINKVIKVVATVDSTSGMAPYTFDIYKENGEHITSNTTGIFFNIGAPDSTLLLNITDHCGASITNQRVKIANLESGAKVAFADNNKVCLGNEILLHGTSVGGALMAYNWTGPEGFSSQSKDPVIENTTPNHEGYYKLSISGLECLIIDSIYITIILPDTGYIHDFTCRGVRYTDYGFNIDPLDVPDTTYIFYRTGFESAEYRCDSTACLFLTVRDYALFSIENVREICADEPFFIIPCNFFDEQKFYYTIQFNDTALLQGFQNVDSGKITHENYIEIAIPQGVDKQDYVLPHHHYSATISVNNGRCNSRIYEFPIQISYPNWIIEQKWNDVFALLNERYNGGYTFLHYEWYKNGEKIEGENGSYIYILPTLDFDAEYRALVTRTSDGEAVFTCSIKPVYRPGMKVYPQIASIDEPLFIETPQPGMAHVWNILGQKVAQFPVFENKINKISINKSGFFIVEIVTINELRETFKIIVK